MNIVVRQQVNDFDDEHKNVIEIRSKTPHVDELYPETEEKQTPLKLDDHIELSDEISTSQNAIGTDNAHFSLDANKEVTKTIQG